MTKSQKSVVLPRKIVKNFIGTWERILEMFTVYQIGNDKGYLTDMSWSFGYFLMIYSGTYFYWIKSQGNKLMEVVSRKKSSLTIAKSLPRCTE